VTDVAASEAAVAALPVGAVPDAAYAARMLAASHGEPAIAPLVPLSTTARPDHIPEQFWDAASGTTKTDDLAKSYAELRAKMDGKAPAAAAAEPVIDPNAPPVDPTKIARPDGEPVANPLTDAVTAMSTAYAADGAVSDDQIAAVEALGLPRAMIDTYFAGLKALEAQGAAEVNTVAGGADKLNAAVTWAATALTDAELAYYNDHIDVAASRTQTVEWLMAKHSAARPSEGKMLGASPASATGDVFRSQDQVVAAMADPRYRTDPAYREATAAKLGRSRQSGTLNNTVQRYK
jgi:hypothetical protein